MYVDTKFSLRTTTVCTKRTANLQAYHLDKAFKGITKWLYYSKSYLAQKILPVNETGFPGNMCAHRLYHKEQNHLHVKLIMPVLPFCSVTFW